MSEGVCIACNKLGPLKRDRQSELAVQTTSFDFTSALGRKAYQRKYRLQRTYGLTIEQFDWVVMQQHSKCAVCKTALGSGRSCHVDHDHVTGKVRGVLCINCNVGIATARDKVEVLASAMTYLHNNQVMVMI